MNDLTFTYTVSVEEAQSILDAWDDCQESLTAAAAVCQPTGKDADKHIILGYMMSQFRKDFVDHLLDWARANSPS